MKHYDPHKLTMKLAQDALSKANDVGYVINYWNLMGDLQYPEVPSIENIKPWYKGLNLK